MINKLPYTTETHMYLKDGVTRSLTKEDIPCDEWDFHNASIIYHKYWDIEDCLKEGVNENSLRDVIAFDNLPELVCLYRGANKDEAINGFGQSWSLSRKTAEFFAFEHYSSWSFKGIDYFLAENRQVFTAFVPKENILMFSNDRNEFECILDPTTTISCCVSPD